MASVKGLTLSQQLIRAANRERKLEMEGSTRTQRAMREYGEPQYKVGDVVTIRVDAPILAGYSVPIMRVLPMRGGVVKYQVGEYGNDAFIMEGWIQ